MYAQGELRFQQFDARDRGSTRGLIESAVAAYGKVDILVNNVGVQADNGIAAHELDERVWDDVIAINLTRLRAT